MQQEIITTTTKGLYLDNSLAYQPKDTYRFALNCVNETDVGNSIFLSNEESTSPYAAIKTSYVLIGKVYLGENQTCLFSVSADEQYSEIGILEGNGTYTVYVNDATSDADKRLNFKISKQIQAVYRLRRGCEKTIYFTDNFNKPRYFNFKKPEDFQTDDKWVAKKFSLVKEYSKIPEFVSVNVLDSGGELEPGSYNVAVQYVDTGLNATEWVTTSDIVYIYNSKVTQNFSEITGSINSDVDFENFPTTSKSIRVDLANLDTDFPFYRLAFIEANAGSGEVTAVKISNVIPTTKNYFIYTGINTVSTGTTEEVSFFKSTITTAGSIEQLENRLLLANVKGSQIEFCKLQKYASRIKADMVLQKVILNDITDLSNPKNPSHRMHNVGYMPGEIYSFGIVYVFEDGSISPTYHIPGKSNIVSNNLVYTDPEDGSYPMSNVKNTSTSDVYIDIGNCPNSDYWGLDSEGNPLNNQPVRHHRFPKRSDLGLSLITTEDTTTTPYNYYRLKIDLSSPLTGATGPFPVNVTYTVDGEVQIFTFTVDTTLYTVPPNATTSFLGPTHSSNAIVVTKIEELQPGGSTIDLIANPGTSTMGSVYTSSVITNTTTIEGNIYSTEIFGIKFSGVDLPLLTDTGGVECVGYYIVRSERTDSEKTIIDSGVIIPNLVNTKYSSHGLLNPDVDASKIDKRVYGLITPEHKFHNKEFTDFDEIEQEGYFGKTNQVFSKTRYNDVQDGTSYNSGQKDNNDDGPDSNNGKGADGWSLGNIIRDTFTTYNNEKVFNIQKVDIEETFYLKALENREINDGANTVYNISADNRVGFVHLKNDNMINAAKDKLPYVILKRDLADHYSNFRTLPYYKDSKNMLTTSVATVFGGDSYVAPIRYTNTMFWDNRIAKRVGKTNGWKYVAGAVLVVLGAILSIGTLGASALIIGAGLTILGGGATLIASGISKDAYNKAYTEEWYKGLRETALDSWVDKYYKQNTSDFGTTGNSNTSDGPSDDEIQWITDSLTDLWFETQVNTNLRSKMVTDTPTYLDAPGLRETGNRDPLNGWEYFGVHYENALSRYPVSALDVYSNRKLLTFDSNRKDNRFYLGVPLGTYYRLNPDYLRINSQKLFFHLPLEYDCCSDCIETFPHRIHYSEQSFQEELVDNYTIFLPNNYRDIEGETGPITNIFKLNNDLFIHTQEALWQMPKNYQERVTDQIVSFIGTGSYFEIPPQKLIDDDTGSSAGLQHKWSALKTPQGYLFVSENQKKIYLFGGVSSKGVNLKVLSDIGMTDYFKENVTLLANEQYKKSTGLRYKYDDNPSNRFGTGFISTYDTSKERFLVTKKDFSLSSTITGSTDFDIDVVTGTMTYFPNLSTTIAEQSALGYNYIGIENSQLKFERLETVTTTETRYEEISVFQDVDFLVFYYVMPEGITDLDTDTQLLVPTVSDRYGWSLPSGINPYIQWSGDNTGSGLESILIDVKALKANYPSALTIEFLAKAYWHTNSNIGNVVPGANINIRAKAYRGTGMIKDGFDFIPDETTVQQGPDYNFPDVFITTPEIGSPTGSQHVGNFVYTIATGDLSVDGSSGGDLPPQTIVTPIEVEVDKVIVTYKYIAGVVVPIPIEANNSWTMSFSLKNEAWVSWHSYLPSMYINTPEVFHSWIPTSNNIWKHNTKNSYQTFYGTYYPHIIEYVSVDNPTQTKIWNTIKLKTDAETFDTTTQEFVEQRFITFNKAVIYNSRQCTGLLNLVPKDTQANSGDYLLQQVINSNTNQVLLDRNERDWSMNDIRDIRIDYTKPIWDSKLSSIQSTYFIDKILNSSTLDPLKDWTQLESFRDKFLVVRLIFDNFANTKLITNYTVENEQPSFS